MDETYLKVADRCRYVYRAMDNEAAVLLFAISYFFIYAYGERVAHSCWSVTRRQREAMVMIEADRPDLRTDTAPDGHGTRATRVIRPSEVVGVRKGEAFAWLAAVVDRATNTEVPSESPESIGEPVVVVHARPADPEGPRDARLRASGRYHVGRVAAGPPDGRIACHGDVAPRNTVFRDGRPVAFVDWDGAFAGAPLWDVAHAAWQFAPLQPDETLRRRGWPHPPDRVARVRVLADGYGLKRADRQRLRELVVEVFRNCHAGVRAKAAAGRAAFQRLVVRGVLDDLVREAAYAEGLREPLRRALLHEPTTR